MRVLIFLVLVCFVHSVFGQKWPIDSNAYKAWPTLTQPILTDDGNYFVHVIQNIPIGGRTLVAQSLDGKWKKDILNISEDYKIGTKSGNLIFTTKGDSLKVLKLGTDRLIYISIAASFWLIGSKDKEWLCYYSLKSSKNLVLRDLQTGREKYLDGAVNPIFSQDGKVLIYGQKTSSSDNQSLIWENLNTGKRTKIYTQAIVDNLIIDSESNQVAFKFLGNLFYLKIGFKKPVELTYCMQTFLKNKLEFVGFNNFSKDGKGIFITLKEPARKKEEKETAEVWSYNDVVLPCEKKDISGINYFSAFTDLRTLRTIRIQQEVDEQVIFPDATHAGDEIALTKKDHGNLDSPWSVSSITENTLVNIRSGQRTPLEFLDNNRTVCISDWGKYLIYFNIEDQNYYSYEISTQVKRNLTKGLKVSWMDLQSNDRLNTSFPRGITKMIWYENDQAVLIYDQNDIWKLDPSNRQSAVNLTNGYGKANHIVFNFTLSKSQKYGLNGAEVLYLNAFNVDNKTNGFYSIDLNKKRDPVLLTMGPYVFCTNSIYIPNTSDFTPIQAKKAGAYVVRRMSASKFPNYFSTKDFKNFTALTDLQPEKNYNWYTTELHTWKSLDGKMIKGILYKPKDFDSTKRYPVIFYYYERLSDGLNVFLNPEVSHGTIDIPTYVSNGYLIFTPDIFYSISNPMQGTYDAVVSAATYLSKLPYVNPQKLGLQGHSFGGLQTNYLVTHTNVFAAAVSASGLADLVSSYGGLLYGEKSMQSYFETGQGRLGGSLWEKKFDYISNSPIFNAEKIITPLLIMHTKKDIVYSYSNAIEFFFALRRLGKRAWMLVYSQGNHSIDGAEASDFSIRMKQYFDHYLKNAPAPRWMTKGEGSNALPNISPYEYDQDIKTPGQGLLTPIEQLKVDSLMKVVN